MRKQPTPKKIVPTVERTRMAGPDHAVVTLKSGPGEVPFVVRAKPCATCPWRVDMIGEFPAEAFKHSAPCAYDMATVTFACHQSGKERPAICAGFALREHHNLAMRLKAASGVFNPDAVSDGGNQLFHDYRAMAVANGVDPDDPVLGPCR